VIGVPAAAAGEEQLFEIAVEAGADDVASADDGFEITTSPAAFEDVKKALAEAGIELASAELTMVPQNTVKLDAQAGVKVLALVDALEENDDIQNVYANFDIPDEVMAKMG